MLYREKILKKVIAKLEQKQALKFLDWLADKFNIRIPSKSEALHFLKNIDPKEIEKAFKYIPLLKTTDKQSFNFQSIKKYIMLLASLAVLAGGVLPANAAEAIKMCEHSCTSKPVDNIFKNFSIRESLSVKDFQSLKTPKSLDKVIEHALKILRPVFKRNNQKDPSVTKVKLFDDNNKEIKTLEDYNKTTQSHNQSIQFMAN